MPSTWHIDMVYDRPERVQRDAVRASGVHAFLSNWFLETDPQHQDLKGYSLGPPVQFANGVRLVVSCVDDSLPELITQLPVGHPVTFGTTPTRVSTAPRLFEETSWNELMAPRPVHQWRLEFTTPVTLRRTVPVAGTQPPRRRQISMPWPAPDPVLSGLRNRWLKFLGPRLPGVINAETLNYLAVTGVDLYTQNRAQTPIDRKDRARRHDDETAGVNGALGTVEWTWLGNRGPDDPTRATIDSLLRFAAYAGCGSYPQHGLGRTLVTAGPG